ncbi:MAG: hypothetical protein AAFY71_04275 [Bacteroidota bacterium]
MGKKIVFSSLLIGLLMSFSFGQNKFYGESYMGITGERSLFNYIGLIGGVELGPQLYMGIGGEFMNDFWNRDDYYLLIQAQLKAYFDKKKRLYGAINIGGGPKILRQIDRNQGRRGNFFKTEWNLGIRVSPYVVLAGGLAYTRITFNGSPIRRGSSVFGSYLEDGNLSLSGKLILTLGQAAKESGNIVNSYGYLEWGLPAFIRTSWEEAFRPFDVSMSAHIGGGIKLRDHLGVGLGINSILGREIGELSFYQNLQAIGVHAMGIWDSFHIMGELGYAPTIAEAYLEITKNRVYLPGIGLEENPRGRSGNGAYFRFSMGPRIKKGLVLHLGLITTLPRKGQEKITRFSPSEIFPPEFQETRRIIWNLQAGIGILVDN